MKLIIVESPTKAKTLKKILGKDFKVTSSKGHIRDLPSKKLGVDIENNFEPNYIIIPKAKKRVKKLKKSVDEADQIILATDPDREGEAISWHLSKALELNKDRYKRIEFHEITNEAIKKAIKNPRKIDMSLVNAQQARRILDRIVGYKLSPFLWKKVARGLSAGRVQSVAVRFIVERERKIKKFKPQEYWTIKSILAKKSNKKEMEASLVKKNDKRIKRKGIKNKKEADKIVKDLKKAEYKVQEITKKEKKRSPYAPFITSSIQQEAWQQFNFPAKFTMSLAQKLYEQGLITYHRTDSLNLSNQALNGAKDFITKEYGKKYLKIRKYKTKGRAQEAHEAIRPTFPKKTPDKVNLKDAQSKLYNLIWRRFIASQMKPAVYDSTSIDIKADKYTLRITGRILKFEGFLKVYTFQKKDEPIILPTLKENEILDLKKVIPKQHFTNPPARYNEASLIKELKGNNIGRPSTYAPILSTIQSRNYIIKNDNKRFQPTEIGTVVNDVLVEHFENIVDAEFTAKMEKELDEVAEGEDGWRKTIKDFYEPFSKNLEKKYDEVEKEDYTNKPTDKKCPKCGSPLLKKLGKFGWFYACSAFPKCKYSKPLERKKLGIKCPKCKKGDLVEKRTRKGKLFYACNKYPDCKFALWNKPITDKEGKIKRCPKCNSPLVKTDKGKIKCSNKDCDFKKIDQKEKK